MADNLPITLGSGAFAATDDVGGVHYQRVKLAQGEDGVAVDVNAANPLHVVTPDALFEVTPTLDTAAYAVGDVLFATTTVSGVARANGSLVTLASLYVVDKDDQKHGFNLFFFDRVVTFGTLNGVPALSDADAAFFMGMVSVVVSDYYDLGGVAVAAPDFNPKLLKPNATDLFIAAVTTGTPTHTANGLLLKLAFARS